jgi:16S rRNA (adenine1518-N6/adenine1519-N6)-dimethyltransferase
MNAARQGKRPAARRPFGTRRHLGQHFLHDPMVIARIIAEIAPQRADLMVEVGGGRGALTRPLLEHLDHLHVIETDRALVPTLEALAPPAQLTVHHVDALKFELDRLQANGARIRVVGNLPYYISTPLLFHFLESRQQIEDLHLMLQKEVVDRMTAIPGGKQYGRLTVMLAAWTDIEACFDIGPGAFNPPPRVRSSFVRVVPRRQPRFEVHDADAFRHIVALAFSMRRKTLRRILKGQLTATEIESAGFDPGARPETLAPADFARLSELTGSTP